MRLGRVLRTFALLVSMVVPIAVLSGQDKAQGPNAGVSRLTIVQLAEAPVASYTGGIRGFAATHPARGQKIDPFDAKVVAYATYLTQRHDAVLARVGGARKAYSYVYAFNGFAAELSEAQAAALKATPGVVAVMADELRQMDTTTTPSFLGLDAAGGLWERLGGTARAGDGIIIGVVDSGIWPESLSFTDRVGLNGNATQDGKLDYLQIPGWHGKCTPGEAFVASMCNQKLIGAQWFNAAWGGDAGIEAARPWEFTSPRDYNGHGSHTTSTAGGNVLVPVTGPAAIFGVVNGIAPHARVAMYKALWSTQDASTASGFNSDLVAAVNQAVIDGVDVINYSISGSLTSFRDPVEIAFLSAADAGVFVAASAGNNGPATSTVAHPSPWITTVAAGTHNRSMLGSVTLGDGAVYTGASVNMTPVTAPVIDSTAAGLPGADPNAVALCYAAIDNGGTAVLDPAKVAGKIVVCDRGTNARVNKSLAVLQAGGVGMILLNPVNNSLNADFHSVPTVHLQNTDYTAVHTYAATAGATATIAKATMNLETPAPYTASFSSRGPLRASGDLLKPDVMAPGQDILAAVSPAGGGGLAFNLYSGTSMSSPHVAGLAALLKALHPDWTPMMVKSALMTSGYDVLDGPNTHPLVVFRQGAGHVRPNGAMNPGLVFDSRYADWLGFLCGTQLPVSYCSSAGVPVLDPSDLNVASIAIADLAGSQVVKRTVTNVGAKGTYSFSVTGLTGLDVTVSPASFTLNPGQTQKLAITITRTTAAFNTYTAGYLTWSDGSHSVRIPVVVRPVALAAPVQVSGNGSPLSYPVRFGYNGPFTVAPRGLVAALTFASQVNTNQSVSFDVEVPAGTTYARFALFDETTTAGSDLDLEVYRGGVLVGSSGGGTSAEEVNFVSPVAATYTVVVNGFATANPSSFTLFAWVLGSTPSGNMSVSAPSTAALGTNASVNLTFSGLTAGTKYLGSVAYDGIAGLPGPTIVRIDP